MSSYATFRIGDVEFGQLRNEVDAEVLAVFTDDMLVRHTAMASEYYPWWRDDFPTEEDSRDADQQLTVVRLVAPGSVIATRLDLMGITAAEVRSLLEHAIRDHATWYDDPWSGEGDEPGYLSELRRSTIEATAELTYEQWRESVVDLDAADWGKRPFDVGSPGWMLGLVDDWEWRHVLRLLLTVWPEGEVELNLTELNEGGWLDDEDAHTLASSALASLRGVASTHSPIVVLTEGRTDAEFLSAALRILHPQLTDLIRFLDFDRKNQGSAGALVTSVKAFAAAGIANRVVALFDNDTAAREALRSLDLEALPSNIVFHCFPDIDLATRYPTLGPPSSSSPEGHIEPADVNGLAGSIELYLGADVLAQPNGALIPVQWRSYSEGVRAYQGEVIAKSEIHERFRAKVARATGSDAVPSLDDDAGDWTGLASILDVIIHAFDSLPLPEYICDHGGRSEARIRVRRAAE